MRSASPTLRNLIGASCPQKVGTWFLYSHGTSVITGKHYSGALCPDPRLLLPLVGSLLAGGSRGEAVRRGRTRFCHRAAGIAAVVDARREVVAVSTTHIAFFGGLLLLES